MSYDHVADLAAPYALGALSDHERAAFEAHVRKCGSCAALVGAAERDVALIASMEARHPAPPELAGRVANALGPVATRRAQSPQWPAWMAGAVAAALLVGLLPSLYFWQENRTLHNAMTAQSEAMERIAAGPHLTAAFRSVPGSPAASVTYAPDGSWYLIVVHDASKALGVAWMHEGRHTMLGKTAPRGSVAMLYLPKSHRMDRLALMDGPRIVAQADLWWQKTSPNRPGARSG
jgi:Putative zinc-finger